MSRPRWLLVDVSSWAYRDLFAAGPGAASLRNFTRRLDLCRQELRPQRIALAFDSDSSFRRQIDASYKANRRDAPLGLDELLKSIRQHALDHEIDCVQAAGFEADDCMATLAGIALDRGSRVVLASRDKDLRQLLIDGAVTMLLAAEYGQTYAEFDYFNARRLETEFELLPGVGMRPDQWIEYQMLVGDKTDDVAGVPGVGDVYAKAILGKCSTLSRFASAPYDPKIPATIRNRVLSFIHSPEADKMRRLVTLRHDVPLPATWFEEAVA